MNTQETNLFAHTLVFREFHELDQECTQSSVMVRHRKQLNAVDLVAVLACGLDHVWDECKSEAHQPRSTFKSKIRNGNYIQRHVSSPFRFEYYYYQYHYYYCTIYNNNTDNLIYSLILTIFRTHFFSLFFLFFSLSPPVSLFVCAKRNLNAYGPPHNHTLITYRVNGQYVYK